MSLGELGFLLDLIEAEDHRARARGLGPAAIRRLQKAGYIAPWAKVFGPQVWVLKKEFSASEIQLMRSILNGSEQAG